MPEVTGTVIKMTAAASVGRLSAHQGSQAQKTRLATGVTSTSAMVAVNGSRGPSASRWMRATTTHTS